jgi:4-amino-4-deoxy-L-arabinose transferase-like glycosyltransferase
VTRTGHRALDNSHAAANRRLMLSLNQVIRCIEVYSIAQLGTEGLSTLANRHFYAVVGALLSVIVILGIGPMTQDSLTADEAYHLSLGYQYLAKGSTEPWTDTPLFSQIVAAIPLVPFHLRFPAGLDGARELIYENDLLPETILLLGRLTRIATTILLAGLVAFWTRRHFGSTAALAATFLFVFDPNFLAHGHYITADVPEACAFFAACLTWNCFLSQGTLRQAGLCGILLGIAVATKFSGILLVPIFVVLYWIRVWQQRGCTPPCAPCLPILPWSLLYTGLTATLTVFAVYGFASEPPKPWDRNARIAESQTSTIRRQADIAMPARGAVLSHPGLAYTLYEGAARVSIPARVFLRQFRTFVRHNSRGHLAYLLGKTSQTGWWYYFLVAFAVKTPTGDLVLILIAAGIFGRFMGGRRQLLQQLRGARFEWYVIILPPVLYFFTCLTSHINIGVRHLLPLYPFVFVGIGSALFVSGKRIPRTTLRIAILSLILVALESIAAYPNYLAFFNRLSGGMSYGARYLSDSNLDWGQDLRRLRVYLDSRHISNVCFDYFGKARPEDYHISSRAIPATEEDTKRTGCVVVISQSTLHLSNSDGKYDWLSRQLPLDRIGGSLLVYVPERRQ